MTDCVHIAKSTLRDHEGLRLKMYKCSEGYNTLGWGFNLDENPVPIEVAEILLDLKLGESVQDLAAFEFWNRLTERRKAALIDMRYCLGPTRFRGFVRMLAALDDNNYERAADEILDSRFAKQTGRRARNLAEMVREG